MERAHENNAKESKPRKANITEQKKALPSTTAGAAARVTTVGLEAAGAGDDAGGTPVTVPLFPTSMTVFSAEGFLCKNR